MRRKSAKTFVAFVCLSAIVSACALPEPSQIPGAALERPALSECPTPTPQGVAMLEAMEDSTGAAVQAPPSPAEAMSGDVVELTAQQVLSREMMLDRINAGPQRPGSVDGVSEPPAPDSASIVEGEQSAPPVQTDPAPTPCP